MGEILDHTTIHGVRFERAAGRCGGKWVLANTRMTVHTLVWYFAEGHDVTAIRKMYPHLTEREVVAAVGLPIYLGPMSTRWRDGIEEPEHDERGGAG